MKYILLAISIFSLIHYSCSNDNNGKQAAGNTDSLSAVSAKIKTSVDSAKSRLLYFQTKLQSELDSLSNLLDNKSAMTGMTPAGFSALQQEVGKRLSDLKKISNLQPLEQKFNTAAQAINDATIPESDRSHKHQELETLSILFKDSINATIQQLADT